jgi:glycosyltransferase involved in cell wall biosynthesis
MTGALVPRHTRAVPSCQLDDLRFSVVVPAYNEACYLGAALQALQQQDFAGSYEIIVVDNDSTDGTAELAASYGVTVVSETARGVCQARQRGAVEARGEIVVSTDADTVQPPDWLTRIDAQFARSDQVVAVAGPCKYENPSWWGRLYPTMLFGAVSGVFALTGRVCYLSATNTAFRRSAFPGYDVTLTQGGDELDLLRRLRRRGPIVWDGGNIVTTSPRRLQKGLFYNFFVTFLTFYVLAYLLNRICSRQILGMAPVFRQERRSPHRVRGGRVRGSSAQATLPPRRRTASSTSVAILRVLRPDRLIWRAAMWLALLIPIWVGLATYALSEDIEKLMRFWAGS